ncbi:replication initiation negative regulator SeqA [Colwellia psychrerythraea]|uniref:Negative modulator of initiation of replication n=1 Tax=Colwellia psychrerythraea TaxID=28229 RepID=A0A099L3T7_COLPS|nr:replication initiation negative regulator SeqA [Colwellia psychrerythraea]KGJ97095.1 SeqA family protein [Colwellia psychrerythraea]
MKNIEIDEELYQYIATNTQYIGESASAILRRLLNLGLDTNGLKADVKTVIVNETVTVNDTAPIKESTKSKVEQPISNDDVAMTNEPEIIEPAKIESVIPKQVSLETVFNFINKEELAMQRGAVGRFLLILAALYRAHPEQFAVVTEISGRDRLYFANSENKLAESGSSTKPRQIPESPFWVITNSNTTRKKMMLTKASISLGYSDVDVEKIRELL